MKPLRVASLVGLCILTVVGLSFRLFSISIIKHGVYVVKAQEQQTVERDVLPKRGTITVQDLADGKTVPAAVSLQSYALSATPRNVTKKKEYAHVLAEASGLQESVVLDSLNQNGLYMPPLKHGLTQEEVQDVAAKLVAVEKAADPKYPDTPVNFDDAQGDTIYFIGGVFFQVEYQRVYPEGGLMGQLLGFVNKDGQGRYGFEEQYAKALSGYVGKVSLETDSVGTLLGQEDTLLGQDGTNYELSIDANIQYVVERELASAMKDSEATGGSVIIENPKTGEIVAMAGNPTYDPNKYSDVSQKDIGVFDNPTISKQDEPGSVFKDVVMAAALDTGAVTPDTKNHFGESVTVAGHKIETALRTDYGEENMAQVLANSDNVGMVWVANKLGSQQMYDYIRKFGFGDPTGIDLSNEFSGSVLAIDQWRDINRATISFGQGISATPLQLVSAYATIANNGKRVRPRMVHAIIGSDGKRTEVPTSEEQQVIKPETAQEIKDMMVYTVAYAHNRAGTPGYKVGGKTGTAQIPDLENGGYLTDQYNHSFVGMAPADDPKYVMLVRLDHPNLQKVGLYAESTAVPLFGKISTFLLHYYQIPPTNK